MTVGIGILVVIVCVAGGYAGAGGHFDVLWQPLEFIIIGGSGIGALIISNPGHVLKGVAGGYGAMFKGPAIQEGTLSGTPDE